jgi:hypothetical protein
MGIGLVGTLFDSWVSLAKLFENGFLKNHGFNNSWMKMGC